MMDINTLVLGAVVVCCCVALAAPKDPMYETSRILFKSIAYCQIRLCPKQKKRTMRRPRLSQAAQLLVDPKAT